MKKLLLFIIAVAFSYSTHGQEFKALDKSPLDMIEYPAQRGVDKVMRVLYSRPQLKGREFSKIVSNGKLWRTGANESTEITFYKSMNFGGKKYHLVLIHFIQFQVLKSGLLLLIALLIHGGHIIIKNQTIL